MVAPVKERSSTSERFAIPRTVAFREGRKPRQFFTGYGARRRYISRYFVKLLNSHTFLQAFLLPVFHFWQKVVPVGN
jgi:hypothetical protein